MAQNEVDIQPYNTLLTEFAIEAGSGGSAIADLLAPPTVSQTQSYAVPKFVSGLVRMQEVNDVVGPDGKPNTKSNYSPDFSTGKCKRRALRGEILDEVKAQPHGDLFTSEQIEIEDKVADLRLTTELAVRTALDAIVVLSGHYATVSTKWDNASPPDLIQGLTDGMRAAELNAGKSAEDPNWKLVIPPLVGDVIRGYLRTKLLYTNGQFVLGGALPAQLAGRDVILPGAMNNSAATGQGMAFARIWNRDDVYLVYVDPRFSNNRRSYTAMAQMRWENVSPSYGVKVFRPAEPDILKTIVSVDIFDNLEVLAQDAMYAWPHVLTTETP